MSPSDVSAPGVGRKAAEAALAEHYPRLVRLGYLILPAGLGRDRRVLAAHALVQRALPGGGRAAAPPALPAQRAHGPGQGQPPLGPPEAAAPQAAGAPGDPGYACLRLRVLKGALRACRSRTVGGRALPWPPRPPLLLPRVLGLRLVPAPAEPGQAALDEALAGLTPAARAAFALWRLDGLPDSAIGELLAEAGVPAGELSAARGAAGELPRAIAAAAPADPCALRALPTDLRRRRRLAGAALAGCAALALLACGLAFAPGDWGPDGPAAPPYARNEAAQAALDPQGLRRIPADVWRHSARTDFSVWPARGGALHDGGLLRRALAVWARPGEEATVSATPGTQTGPPPGPAQLLFAGRAADFSVVLLYDGLRLVRYAEPAGAGEGGALLDFARADGADARAASAVVLARRDGNTTYLTAPWVTGAAVSDLLDPAREPAALAVDEAGVTAPLRTAAGTGDAAAGCAGFPVLSVGSALARDRYLLADLGELTPALLTHGAPESPSDAAGDPAARAAWARIACGLPQIAGGGVRAVNLWPFAEQDLPDGGGRARWLCLRAETWRGAGSRSLTEFLPPAGDAEKAEPGSLTAADEDAPACGPRQAAVLSGVLWKSPRQEWYLLAAGSQDVTRITAEGGVRGQAEGRTLVLPAAEGARVELTARLADGNSLTMLGN
ncbi:hypothetical protein [Streptomyces hoynatensis]|uniref:Uncharacterized protein n=1 Tax=Streptomyces hoynatensis TaxID=1141874 RepID=A0A3A9Z167_9ACTN|nr:hypothetical protein [Streptomyces hoynatensis]RKN42212.1 hypothetical protein D7294_12215 [Streptomyces hoynatensis]